MIPRILCALSFALLLAGPAPVAAGSGQEVGLAPASAAMTPDAVELLAAEHGIRVDGVRLASAGHMLDFRYWVTDEEKAWALFREERRELVHPASGARAIVPAPAYVGRLSQTTRRPKQDRRYFVFFANPGKIVAPGDLVTIFIGDVEIGPLRVR